MNRLSRVRNGSALMLALSALWSAGVCAADDASAFDHVQQIQAGDLNIGYVDIGPRDGQPVILLHGWPYDIHSYAAVAPALAKQGFRVIVPYLRGMVPPVFSLQIRRATDSPRPWRQIFFT